MLVFEVDLKVQQIHFYWQNNKGEKLQSIKNLKNFVESKGQSLIFAMNGGMFNKDYSPKGLFVQNHKIQTPLDTMKGIGNFYLQPNGVFYINKDKVPIICKTGDFANYESVMYATQSGPMLLIYGEINSAFNQSSINLNIRNGVGILPNQKVVFAMSKKEINFYDFARYFQRMGCINALYLDGYVSRAYLPEKEWVQLDGNFGVIIGVVK